MSEGADLGRRAAKAAAWLAAARWINLALSIGVTIVLARLLGPQTWGLFAAAMIPVAVAQPLVDGALGEGLIRRERLDRGHMDAVFWVGSGLAGMVALGLALGADWVGAQVGAPQAGALVAALGVTLVLSAAANAPSALLQRAFDQRQSAFADTGATLAASGVGLCAGLAGAGVWSLAAMELARGLVKLVWLMVAARWAPGLALRAAHVRELAGFNGAALAIRCVTALDQAVPRMVIGAALGQTALGCFALAWRLYEQVSNLFVGPMNAIALPAAARGKADPAALRTLLVSAIRVSTLVGYPAFLGLAVTAPAFVALAFGADWAAAVAPVQILALLGLRAAISSFNGGLLRGADRAGWQLIVVLVGLGLIAALAPLAAPFGLAAVAAAVTARGFLTWPLGAWFVSRAIGLPMRAQAGAGAGALGAGLVMACATLALDVAITQHWSAAPRFTALVVAGVMAYGVGLLAFAPRQARGLADALKAGLARDRAGVLAALRRVA